MSEQTAEQRARDMLERMGVEDAQSFTAGDVVELANLIARPSLTPADLIALRELVGTWRVEAYTDKQTGFHESAYVRQRLADQLDTLITRLSSETEKEKNL